MSTDAVVIWGELLWDRYVAPTGSEGSGGDSAGGGDGGTSEQLGGAPANVAWHLAQAGGWAQLITRIGDDAAGRRALDRLDGLVDTSLIQIDPERATGEVTIALDRGEPRYTLHPGRAWEWIACTDEVRAAIDEAGVFIYGTLAQRTSEGHAQWTHAIAAARARAVKVYDANLRPNDQASHAIVAALDHADVVKLNDREVAQLGQLFGWDDPIARVRAPIGRAHDGRPRILVVTHGAAGSTIYPLDGAPIEIAGVAAAPGGDNVGCGDAYLALFVFGMTSGWDLATSGRIASRWAAAVAEVRGATPLFDDDRITDLLEAS
ncbi:MAG TPA: PfkB family carbohydrate kinase [Kofleriaceae bacterium]|nr:PfkB family carbohydrate kinase [Kofleriaceae bacterium]